MEVRTLVEELDLEVIAAPVVAVPDVDRLVHVLDEVDQELEGLLPLDRGALGRPGSCGSRRSW